MTVQPMTVVLLVGAVCGATLSAPYAVIAAIIIALALEVAAAWPTS